MLLYSMFVLVCAHILLLFYIWISRRVKYLCSFFLLSFLSLFFISTTIKKLWRHWKSAPDATKICFRAKGRRSLWAISEIMHHSLHRKVASGLTREKTGENWIYSLFEAALFTCIWNPRFTLYVGYRNLQVAARFTPFRFARVAAFFILWCFDLMCRWIEWIKWQKRADERKNFKHS